MLLSTLRVSYKELSDALLRALLKTGFELEDARLCAKLFADSSLDGVYSHGVNRFPRFVKMIRSGVIDIHARPVCIASHGAVERWDGKRGPGNLNAYEAMERAIELSSTNGIECG